MTPGERAAKMTDRPSRYFVIVSVAVFVLILLYGLLGGHGGFLTPTPTASPEPSATRRALRVRRSVRIGRGQRVARGVRFCRAVGRAIGRRRPSRPRRRHPRLRQRRPVTLAVLTRA